MFYSCEKEIIENTNNTEDRYRNKIYPSNQRAFIEDESKPQWPNVDLYKYVLNKLYSDSIFNDNQSNLVQYYGYPRLNFATINTTTPYEYILTIPIVLNEEITAFIFYFANGSYGQFAFAPTSIGFDLLTKNVSEQVDPVAFLTLAQYNNYQINRYSKYYPSVNNWLVNYLEYNQNLQYSSERNEEVSFWIETVGPDPDTGEEIVVRAIKHTFIIPCGDSGAGGYGGFWDPSIPGGGNSGSSPDTPPDEGQVDIESPIDPTEINQNCINYLFSKGALDALKDIAKSTIYSCNSDLSTDEIIENILDKLCKRLEDIPTLAGGGFEISEIEWPDLTLTGEDIYSAFLEEDYVIMNRMAACPKLKCLMDILTGHHDVQEGENPLATNILCEYLHGFLGENWDNSRHLHIQTHSFGNDPNIISNANAFVRIEFLDNNPEPQIFMVFNSDKCESSSTFSLFETFVHELIHADIWRRLIEDHGWTNYDDNEHAFSLLLKEMGYDGTNWDDQHQLMLAHYLESWSQILWEANDKRGLPGDYYGIIFNGFPLDILVASGWFDNYDDAFDGIQNSLDILKNDLEFHENFSICD